MRFDRLENAMSAPNAYIYHSPYGIGRATSLSFTTALYLLVFGWFALAHDERHSITKVSELTKSGWRWRR